MQLKPLVEKNKRMSKKNEELLQSIQRMEEKLKALARENAEVVRADTPRASQEPQGQGSAPHRRLLAAPHCRLGCPVCPVGGVLPL